jgi:hypothetical protein
MIAWAHENLVMCFYDMNFYDMNIHDMNIWFPQLGCFKFNNTIPI